MKNENFLAIKNVFLPKLGFTRNFLDTRMDPVNEEGDNTKDMLDALSLSDVPYTVIPQSEVLDLGAPTKFSHVFSLLYTLEAQDELSPRALHLTSEALKLNASNPTTWMYRRRVVKALSCDQPTIWDVELAFTAITIKDSRKNYQAWEHRRYCVETTGKLETEPEFVDVILQLDAKNYHAWAHRAWVVRRGFIQGELDVTDWYIQSDVRNNSAWNHRWLVVKATGMEGEVTYACKMAAKAPRNESVWNYLLALSRAQCDMSQAQCFAKNCLAVDAACTPARRFLVLTSGRDDAKDVLEHTRLLAGDDRIRNRYWIMQNKAAQSVLDDAEKQ